MTSYIILTRMSEEIVYEVCLKRKKRKEKEMKVADNIKKN
jgi:hypothetical protein